MTYKRYKMLQKYINGEAQEEYKQGELIDDTTYETLEDCNEGNQNPDKPIEGYIYQWVTVSGEYVCSGVNKYTKQKEQKSSNNGVTWTDTGRTRQGDLIEVNSADCGYVPPTPGGYENQYLTFEALEDGTFTFTGTSSNSLSYSNDGGQTWIPLASGVESPTVTRGNKIMWKGITTPEATTTPFSGGIGIFSSNGTFKVYGNTMSIVYGDNFKNSTTISDYQFKALFNETKVVNAENLVLPATTLAEHCYDTMFDGCTSLTTTPVLPATTLAKACYGGMFYNCTSLTTTPVLPATTLANNCYNSMFQRCTSLTSAPALPATTLAEGCYVAMFNYCAALTTAPELPATTLTHSCYYHMFDGCTSLTSAPALPATTLVENCYYYMFNGCTSLVKAPELPATTLAKACYHGMFQGCTKLNYIKAMFTTTPSGSSPNYYTKDWVSGVSSTGTFVKNSEATWTTTGVNGIPSGWTVINE